MKDPKQMSDSELKEEIQALKDLIDETNKKIAISRENNDKQVLKIIEICESIVSVSKVEG